MKTIDICAKTAAGMRSPLCRTRLLEDGIVALHIPRSSATITVSRQKIHAVVLWYNTLYTMWLALKIKLISDILLMITLTLQKKIHALILRIISFWKQYNCRIFLHGMISCIGCLIVGKYFRDISFWQQNTLSQTLTIWGRLTYIYASNKLTTIGSDNDLSSGRRQAIIWTNAAILSIWPFGNKIQWSINRNSHVLFQENVFENMSSLK